MNPRNLPHTHSFEYTFRHPIERVWDYVTHTDRVNRSVGLPPPTYTHEPKPGGGSNRYGAMTVLGFPLRWLEHPYEWVRHKYFWNQRDYLSGPLKANDICWEFEPTPNGCKVRQTFCFEAKNWLFTQIAHHEMGVTLKKNFLRSFAHIDAALDKREAFPFPPTFPGDRALDDAACQALRQKLTQAGLNAPLANTFTELIARSPEPDLVRIRPFAWAKRWNIDRLDALRAFLTATKAGIFELSWDLLCPSCRGAKVRGGSLSEVTNQSHCDSCNVDFSVEFDQSVELSFTVSSTVRKVNVPAYCVGGPQNTPHCLSQLRLKAGQSVTLDFEVPPGVYKVRSLSAERHWQISVTGEAVSGPPLVARFEEGSERRAVRVESSSGKVELVNAMKHEIVAMVEHAHWLEDACTAAVATSLQDFRDMFSSEVLRAGQEIKVGAIALLFTDLRGSTAMYGRIGDAPAFSLVMDHFAILTDCVRRHQGALVKTIGDAVMASFTRPEDAVKAAIDIHRRIDADNRTPKPNGERHEPLTMKIGIHYGPCYAVNSNDRLDYFGTTVNIAARTEGQCEGGDIVISSQMMKEPGVEQAVRESGLKVTAMTRALKGFNEYFELYRIDCLARNNDDAGARF